jgi:sugar transferase (PEP-CTERM/EpsH1 system associated)
MALRWAVLMLIDKAREMPLDGAREAFRENVEDYSETVGATADSQSANIARGSFPVRHAREELRVLHVIDRLDVGGTELGIARVIRGLNGENFNHRVCAIRGFNEDFVAAQSLAEKVCVAGSPKPGYQFLVGRLTRVMREFKPHVVHSRNWGGIEAIPAARLARVPVAIHSEHGYEVDMLAGLPIQRRIMRRFAYTSADVVFTVSEELRNYHARQTWLPAERIRVLPNGVDTTKFCPLPGQRAEMRRQFGLTDDLVVCGSVGRLVAIKDYSTLLQATKILVERGLPICLLLVGAGPELISHQRFVAASPDLAKRVKFLRPSTDVAAFLNALDIFVLPSLREGMSNTLLEAMAAGLPIVASRVGGNPEIIQEENSGCLFKAGDVTELTARLEHLAHCPALRRKWGQAARERAESEFSLERMIDRYHDLYLDMYRRRDVGSIPQD